LKYFITSGATLAGTSAAYSMISLITCTELALRGKEGSMFKIMNVGRHKPRRNRTTLTTGNPL